MLATSASSGNEGPVLSGAMRGNPCGVAALGPSVASVPAALLPSPDDVFEDHGREGFLIDELADPHEEPAVICESGVGPASEVCHETQRALPFLAQRALTHKPIDPRCGLCIRGEQLSDYSN